MLKIPIFVVNCERIGRRQAYHVRFYPNDQLLQRIKGLPEETRKWSPLNYAWEISTYSLFSLIKHYKNSNKIHFDFGNDDSRKIFIDQIKKLEKKEVEKRKFIAELEVKKEQWVKYKEELETTHTKFSAKLHSFLKEGVVLYAHQIVAALFMNVTRSTLISHEMGLGKTLAAILYVEMNGFDKVLVITPNSLKFNFYDEVNKFTNSNAHIIKWRKNTYSIEDAKYIIVNYEYFNPKDKKAFDKKFKDLGLGKINAVICDESHRLKNTKSNTYKNFKRTFKKTAFVDDKISKIFLSGTPAPNRAHELYSVLNQISSVDFATKKHFNEYYCGMTYDLENGWTTNPETMYNRLEELYYKISPFTHRKLKKEVLTDLPDKTYQRVMLEMTDKEENTYEAIEEGIADELDTGKKMNHLTIMIRLRQFTSQRKLSMAKELIDNILESGEKVVIVDVFKNTLYALKEELGYVAGLHTGDQSVEERAEIVKKFQDPDSDMRVFLGSIQTCNYGLTLTAASKLIIITLPYSVGEYDQVSDRLHRIGQLNAVNIYVLIFPDTIDDYIYSAIEGKRKEIKKVLDNENYKSDVSESVVSEVIKRLKNKHGRNI